MAVYPGGAALDCILCLCLVSAARLSRDSFVALSRGEGSGGGAARQTGITRLGKVANLGRCKGDIARMASLVPLYRKFKIPMRNGE